jgi:hypothetical protein
VNALKVRAPGYLFKARVSEALPLWSVKIQRTTKKHALRGDHSLPVVVDHSKEAAGMSLPVFVAGVGGIDGNAEESAVIIWGRTQRHQMMVGEEIPMSLRP